LERKFYQVKDSIGWGGIVVVVVLVVVVGAIREAQQKKARPG